jgi:hypothetical protein
LRKNLEGVEGWTRGVEVAVEVFEVVVGASNDETTSSEGQLNLIELGIEMNSEVL